MQDKRRWLARWQRIELVELCLDRGLTRRQAAAWRRVSVSTVQYWVGRYRSASDADRVSGAWAQERPSTPHGQPARVSERVHDRVCEARERTGWGPRLIASELGMAHATVSRCLMRRGISRRPAVAREAVRRFEWPCPGDLLQMDTKRLARFSRPGHKVTGDRFRTGAEKRAGVGWEFCHSMIDDHTRLGLHRDPPRRESRDRRRLRRAGARLLRRPRRHRAARADRQRLGLRPQPRPARAARPARDRAPHDPAAHAEAQREGVCLSFGGPSGRAARLPAPGDLTQAKGMSREISELLVLAQRSLSLACVRFVDRRDAGGPAKLT